jgi:hypothetical protein
LIHRLNFNSLYHILKKPVLAFVIILMLHSFSFAQNSTDSVKVEHSPRKASIYSAVLPGLGQGYNKKYWKIPIIYAGFGGLTYVAVSNTQDYRDFRDAYIFRTDGDSTTIDNYPEYTIDNLVTLKNQYRKNLERAYIGMALLYILNIIDASVDAHLYDFNVSDDLALKVEPIMLKQGFFNTYSPGIKFTLSFK